MAETPKTILVIGGGLGGLAFAQIVRHSEVAEKYKAMIYERDASATHREQGYQIGINKTGLSCLSSIPHIATLLDTMLHDKVNPVLMLDHKLNIMLELRQVPGPDGWGSMVNRWKLRQALAEGLDVQWGKKFVRYEETESEVSAYFEDGTHVVGDLLIGADGAKSKVRAQRCPDLQLENIPILSIAGCIALTPVIKSKLPRLVELTENAYLVRVLAPKGISVLLMNYAAPVDNGEPRLIWGFSFPSAKALNFPTDQAEMKIELDSMANEIFSNEVATLITETMIEDYIFDVPRSLQSVVPLCSNPLAITSRVTLLGDAAHAMTTHRGLGANTAFADAADLAHALMQQDDDPWLGLAHYQEVMIKRGFEAVKVSKQITRTIHLTGMPSMLRNVLIRAIGWILWAKRIVLG